MTNKIRCNKIPYKNKTNKLTPKMINTLCKLYQKGWKAKWLNKKFKVHYTSICYYIKKYDLIQKNILTSKEIKKIKSKYDYTTKQYSTPKEMTHKINKTYTEKTYDTSVRSLTSLHDTECSHKYWIKRCSLCNAILESDMRVNKMPVFIEKDVYNKFDRIVCSYSISKLLAKNNVEQESVLYWVYHIKLDVLQLKSKQNIPDRKDKKTNVFAAFTTQELCKRILKNCSNNDILLKLAKIADKPNELACLLIDILKK